VSDKFIKKNIIVTITIAIGLEKFSVISNKCS